MLCESGQKWHSLTGIRSMDREDLWEIRVPVHDEREIQISSGVQNRGTKYLSGLGGLKYHPDGSHSFIHLILCV